MARVLWILSVINSLESLMETAIYGNPWSILMPPSMCSLSLKLVLESHLLHS